MYERYEHKEHTIVERSDATPMHWQDAVLMIYTVTGTVACFCTALVFGWLLALGFAAAGLGGLVVLLISRAINLGPYSRPTGVTYRIVEEDNVQRNYGRIRQLVDRSGDNKIRRYGK